MKELRKAREEHIHALKNTNEPQLHRRTLRKALKFYSDNPSQRMREVQAGDSWKVHWQQQFSLPVGGKRDSLLDSPSFKSRYRRSASAPDGSTSTFEDIELSELLPKSGQVTLSPPRRQNPLRLMKRSTDYFDQQKARLGGGKQEERSESERRQSGQGEASLPKTESTAGSMSTAEETAGASASTSESRNRDSDVFVFPNTTASSPPILKKRQTSSPEGYMQESQPISLSYEKTQSLPGDIPSGSRRRVVSSLLEEELPMLKTAEETEEEPGKLGERC